MAAFLPGAIVRISINSQIRYRNFLTSRQFGCLSSSTKLLPLFCNVKPQPLGTAFGTISVEIQSDVAVETHLLSRILQRGITQLSIMTRYNRVEILTSIVALYITTGVAPLVGYWGGFKV